MVTVPHMNSQIVHFHPFVVKCVAFTNTGTLTVYMKQTVEDKMLRIIVINAKQLKV